LAHLLYIEGSPRKQRSASIEVAKAAVAAWLTVAHDPTVDTIDVWSSGPALPEFDGPVMEAKYAGIAGTPLTAEQELAWLAIRNLSARFHAADVLLIAAPLWNFSIPYKLKHLIDAVTQKDLLFSFDERGLNGLLHGKSALIICARGLDYSADGLTPAGIYDFQKPYIEAWLRFVGVEDIATVTVEKTLFGPDIDSAARANAKVEAVDVIRRYAGHKAPQAVLP
jgi:FMN-dependent NADH-azoreductase